MKKAISCLLFIISCKEYTHEVKDDGTKQYQLDLSFAEEYGQVTVKGNCNGTATRCVHSSDKNFPVKLKSIKFPTTNPKIDTENKPTDAYGIATLLPKAEIEFSFKPNDNETYDCTLKDVLLGTIKDFTVGENCRDTANAQAASGNMKVFYTYQVNNLPAQEEVSFLNCKVGGKEIKIHTGARLFSYARFDNLETSDSFKVECKRTVSDSDHDTKEVDISKDDNTYVQFEDNGKIAMSKGGEPDEDHVLRVFIGENDTASGNAMAKILKKYSKQPTDKTKLSNIYVSSSSNNIGNFRCYTSCLAREARFLVADFFGGEQYLAIGQFCYFENKNKKLTDLAANATVKCSPISDPETKTQHTLTQEIIKSKTLCISLDSNNILTITENNRSEDCADNQAQIRFVTQ